MIPDEAVEAALEAYRAAIDADNGDYKDDMRAALEAAAPHMLAEAWESGREVGLDQDFEATTQIANPHRPAP